MQQIQLKARLARRRLLVERFLAFLPYSLGGLLMVATVALMLPKVTNLQVDSKIWYGCWIGAATALGLTVNFVMTWIGRPSLADAACEIDRRFQLRERLTSALTLTPQDQQSHLGQALISDADRRAEAIDISSLFSWGLNRRFMVPLLPVLLSGLYFVIPDRPQPADIPSTAVPTTLVKTTTQPLLEQIRKKREEAEKQELTDAAEMFKRLEGELEKMIKDPKLDAQKALAKLNDIKDQLNERRKELGSAESLKKNLQNLEKFDSGPMEKLADALKSGDMEKAQQSLEELIRDLKGGKMDAAELEKLKKELEQLSQSLQKAAAAHEQAKQNLQQEIRKAQETGDHQRAGQLQRKLEQMQAMDKSMAQMQDMAQMLSKCEQCMGKNDQAGMQESLEQMSDMLGELNAGDDQLQDLDQLMDSLSECKTGMCQGTGKGENEQPGRGMGEGRGDGDRPEEESEVDFFQSQVRAQVQPGQNVFSGKIGGENRKGLSRVEVQEEIVRDLTSEPEPLDETALPRSQREHTRDYFDSIREGK